jgi:cytoskeletal protein CcmA (bactofilin family)
MIQGDLIFAGDVVIHGRLEGTLYTDGHVRIEEGGSVDGGIRARTIEVWGIARGRLEAPGRVVLHSGSLVQAEVDTPVLDVEDGARFYGRHDPDRGRNLPKVQSYRVPDPGRA